jgi:arylsulfatase A-like enzyme
MGTSTNNLKYSFKGCTNKVKTVVLLFLVFGFSLTIQAQKKNEQPNILVIFGDDIGYWNIGAYHNGMMAGVTPNMDKLAKEGAIFTDYYTEASCTAGRANFITGMLPIRTGLTSVGLAGSPIGMPDAAPTIAEALKDQGYATGQFGKNHLGDNNRHLPTAHGFDEFMGYLYHLNAMEDPFNANYPQDMVATVGPRNVIHSWATDKDDPTVQDRWGKVGKQKIEDKGPLPPHPTEGIEFNMETFDDVIIEHTNDFIERSHKDGKPFFVWMNTTRMHVNTHLSPKYLSLMTPENEWTIQEAGMVQFDDIIGEVVKKLEDMGIADNTIIIVTTDNGTENFSWPDGGNTPFRGTKGTTWEGGFRSPQIVYWPGKVKPDQYINGVMSGLDWFPTLVKAAGYKGDIVADLKKGTKLNGKDFKVHLDGFDQTELLTQNGKSARNEVFYFAASSLGALRVGNYKFVLQDQPNGWFGGGTMTYTAPRIFNLRLDPFERLAGLDAGLTGDNGSYYGAAWWNDNMWRMVDMQRVVASLMDTMKEFPPMQSGGSFNLDSVKDKAKPDKD